MGLRMGRDGQMQRSISIGQVQPKKSGPPRKVDRLFHVGYSGPSREIATTSLVERQVRVCWMSCISLLCCIPRKWTGIHFYRMRSKYVECAQENPAPSSSNARPCITCYWIPFLPVQNPAHVVPTIFQIHPQLITIHREVEFTDVVPAYTRMMSNSIPIILSKTLPKSERFQGIHLFLLIIAVLYTAIG